MKVIWDITGWYLSLDAFIHMTILLRRFFFSDMIEWISSLADVCSSSKVAFDCYYLSHLTETRGNTNMGGGVCRYPSSRLPMPSDRVSDPWQGRLLFVYEAWYFTHKSPFHCTVSLQSVMLMVGTDANALITYIITNVVPGALFLSARPTLIGQNSTVTVSDWLQLRLTTLQMLSLQIRSSLLGILSQHRLVCVVRMWAKDIGPMSRAQESHFNFI